MKIVGLCGGSGSGKGKVCEIFREKGIPCIDTDAVYRQLTGQPGALLDALIEEFGNEIISDDKSLNRGALARIVFSSENKEYKLSRLNEIAHKYILDETRRILASHRAGGSELGVVDAPVLFESGFDKECDIIISVVADRQTRISRIIARDHITSADAEQRIASQMSDDELISRSDYVIYNNSDIESLNEQIVSLLAEFNEK